MGLFDANLKTLKRVFEHTWRELAHLAAEKGHLYVPRARLELKLTMWVYANPNSRTATEMFSTSQKFDLVSGQPAKERGPKPPTSWQRIMKDE